MAFLKKNQSELHKTWKRLKDAASAALRRDLDRKKEEVLEEIKNFEKDPGKDVNTKEELENAMKQHKQNKVAYLGDVFGAVNLDLGEKSAPDFAELFPSFDKGFGGKLDDYVKAAAKGDGDKKRDAALEIAKKYKAKIVEKIDVLEQFDLNAGMKALGTCADFLEAFIDGEEDEAVKLG